MKNYDCYLFDADGTLFDTIDLICDCFQFIAKKHLGQTLDRTTIVSGIGSPLVHQLGKHLGPDIDIDTILSDYNDYQLRILKDRVSLFPGSLATLTTLKNSGKRLGIVTSRRRPSLEMMLEITGLGDIFDILVTPEDTSRHKPDAEPTRFALEKLGALPSQSILTGDAHYDICSGASAGTDTAFVGWSHITRESLPVAPTWTIQHMEELLHPAS